MKKYNFVYKTRCLITNHYYLGVHSTNDLDDGYIGSGIKFLNYVKKYGKENFTKEIIRMCETRDEAFEYEKNMITEAILRDDMCLNLTVGGKGYKHEYDETFKTRISKTRKIRLEQGKIIPVKHTKEHKQRMREFNPGGEATSRAIYQIDPNTGKIIKEWRSSRNAGMVLKIKSWRNISKAAKVKNITVKGFFWRWVDDADDIINGVLQNVKQMIEYINDPSRASKPIIQIKDDGTEITWKNMCEAARQLNIDNSAISYAIKKQKQYAGSFWKKQ